MKSIILKLIYFILAVYARKVIRRHRPVVIGITGSVGKTSAKEAVFQVMHDHFGPEVRKTAGNLNAEIGIPLTILGYDRVPPKYFWPFLLIGAYFRTFEKSYPKYLILEMGVEHLGDIRYFSSITELDIAIITSVAPAHLSNFKDIAEFQAEKLSITESVKELGKIIVNADDPVLAKLSGERLVTIGIENQHSDYTAKDITVSDGGTDFRINSVGQKIAVKSKLIGKHLVSAELFAFAVGQIFGIQSLKIKASLEKIAPYKGRMNLIEGKNGTLIIDDTYNANPTSVRAALDVLKEMKHKGRKVAIIGNMNELGPLEKEAHKEVGAYAKGKCDLAIFAGKNASLMAQSYGSQNSVFSFGNRIELMKDLDKIIEPDDLILVKASQNKNFFEEVVKRLMKKPERASEFLVRQEDFWLSKKKNNY